MKRTRLKDRVLPTYSKGEELFNMITHIIGGIVGVIALILCTVFATLHQNWYGLAGGLVFGFSMIFLYASSSIYHGLSPNLMAKKLFQIFDHCTIFLLIAGTYTPLLLTVVREYKPILAWSMLALVWTMAIIGIVLNSIDIKKYKTFSFICYLAMGWCVVFTAGDLVKIFDNTALILLVSGGIAYTIGAMLYLIGKKKKFIHSVWHICVNLGSILHFLCILLYAM